MSAVDISQSEEIYSVSRLNSEVRFLLESNFAQIWVEGEISNFAAPRSGHWYFSLKDSAAQVRCAMFRSSNRSTGFIPVDGMHVLARVRISLYEGRGDYQLLVERIEEIGEGKLRQAYEALKKRLASEGLFDEARKKTLPAFPCTIGVITSPTGAAVRDILSVLKRRYSSANVIIYPAQVQGDAAAATIVEALQTANRRAECDILLLARGGGSLEDLWPFNEEAVAYAISRSEIPIISGVGHETDFTIADFVADLRAPTPSVAAEYATPDASELTAILSQSERQLARLMQQKLIHLRQALEWSRKHLEQQHPVRRISGKIQQLDHYEISLVRLQKELIRRKKAILETLSAQLHALSPLAVLGRGFSIASRLTDGKILRNVKDISPGDKVNVRLEKGALMCTVDECQC